jgi:murein DD-endopeptidase MepM/ murein hydrolase activator NlpD
MSDHTTLTRRGVTSALLGALLVTGPWTVPAAGQDDSYNPHQHRHPHPSSERYERHERHGNHERHERHERDNDDYLGIFEAYDTHGDESFYEAPARSEPAAATRTSPVTGYPVSAAYGISGSWAAGHHTGVDFATPAGTTARSVGPGRVVLAAYAGDYGNAVMVKLDDGYYVLYAHLSQIAVKEDEKVETGTKLGKTGSTGRSTGPHLHFEIRTDSAYGTDVDPVAYLARHGASAL